MGTWPSVLHSITDEPRFVGYTQAKHPVDPKTGAAASVGDPATWGTFEQTAAWAAHHHGHVGVVPLDDLVFLDLDGAVADGRLADFTQEWLIQIGCDAERSVSGTGLHFDPAVVWDQELRDLVAERKVFADGPIERVEVRTRRMGTIVGGTVAWPATKSPAAQTAAVKDLLRALRPDPSVTARAGLAREAKRQGHHRDYQTAKLLRRLDPHGARFLAEEAAIAGLAAFFPHHMHPRRAAKRRIELLCRSPFGQRRRTKDTGGFSVALRSEESVAQVWGVPLGQRVKVKVGALAARDRRGIRSRTIGSTTMAAGSGRASGPQTGSPSSPSAARRSTSIASSGSNARDTQRGASSFRAAVTRRASARTT